jgi:hypothetical protein
MLNDARLNVGKSPLGFLNSFLYSSGYTALNDITAGNNPGCGTQGFNVCHIYVPSSRVTDLMPCAERSSPQIRMGAAAIYNSDEVKQRKFKTSST